MRGINILIVSHSQMFFIFCLFSRRVSDFLSWTLEKGKIPWVLVIHYQMNVFAIGGLGLFLVLKVVESYIQHQNDVGQDHDNIVHVK